MNSTQILLLTIFLFSSIIHITSGLRCWDNDRWNNNLNVVDVVRDKKEPCKTCTRTIDATVKFVKYTCRKDDACRYVACKTAKFYEPCCCKEDRCNKEDIKPGGEEGTLECTADGAKVNSIVQKVVKKNCLACGKSTKGGNTAHSCFEFGKCGETYWTAKFFEEITEYKTFPKGCKEKDGVEECCCEKNNCNDPTKAGGSDDDTKTDESSDAGSDDGSGDGSSDGSGKAKGAAGMSPKVGVLAFAFSLGGILTLHQNLQ